MLGIGFNPIVCSREDGYYWVEWLGERTVAEWYNYISVQDSGAWRLTGDEGVFRDSDFEKIGMKIECPDFD